MLFQGGDRSRQFYRSQSIREVLPRLLRGLRNSLGPCLLTARHGTGRTALLRQIQQELERDGRAVVVSAAALDSPAALMKLILHCIARPSAGSSNSSTAESPELTHWGVIQHLQKSVDFWGPVFLILDDIHLLAPPLLNELRALSEEEWQGRGLVKILASAPLSFEMQLARPEYQSFAQRLCCHEVLAPFTVSESLELLRLEIESAGGRPERIFSESAAALLTSVSEGLPRQLSLLANESLTVAADLNLRPADESSVRAALKQVQHLSLTWNLPTSIFEDDADENDWHQSQTIEVHETPLQQATHWMPGIVEVGAPFTAPTEFTEDSDTRVTTDHTNSPEITADSSAPAPLSTSLMQPLTPATFGVAELAEQIEPVGPINSIGETESVSRRLWDPDSADFSSISPVPDRFSEPLNFGLISGQSEVFEVAGLQYPPAPPAALNIPELNVSDSEVFPELAPAAPHYSESGLHDPDPATSPSLTPLNQEFAPPLDSAGDQSSSTAETIDEEFQRLDRSGIELFHAYTGRRLTAAPSLHSERSAGDFGTSGDSSDSPISVPMWRDGSLLEQQVGLTPAPEQHQKSEQPGEQASATPSDDVHLDATARFATLFTRLRKLQSRSAELHGTDKFEDSSDGTRH